MEQELNEAALVEAMCQMRGTDICVRPTHLIINPKLYRYMVRCAERRWRLSRKAYLRRRRGSK